MDITPHRHKRDVQTLREGGCVMAGRLKVEDLPLAAQRKFGIKRPRKSEFSKEAVRTNALRVLDVIANLTQDQRRRVLEHAVKVNAI
jgi:hypothetical protein